MSRLALFVSSMPRGAIQRILVLLAREFVARGHDVDLVAARVTGPRPIELPSAVRITDLHTWVMRLPLVRRQKRWWVPRAVGPLADYLQSQKPDALLAAGEYANLTALRARRKAASATRIVTSEHIHISHSVAGGPLRRKWLLKRAVRRLYPDADGVVAVSDGAAADLAAFAGLPVEHVLSIYNPVVTPELLARRDAPLEHPWFADDQPPVFVCVAQLRAQKDLPTLLHAFARLRKVREARLLILGEGNRRRELSRLAADLDLGADVAMPGFVDNPIAFMAHAAALVLSSSYEGLPTVLIEALACGCPVVSTDCPSGPAEILGQGKYGRLVPVGDQVALAEAMLETLNTPPERDRLIERAQDFRAGQAADRYLEILIGPR
jgi:glycosyltransferase involved in cell wall biosynthesis